MTARRRGTQVEALPRTLSYARPKGEQLQEILEGVIAALQPGALLPSERLLAERYEVARATVTQAVEGLVLGGRDLGERGPRGGDVAVEHPLPFPWSDRAVPRTVKWPSPVVKTTVDLSA